MRGRLLVAALLAVMALAGCGADETAGGDDVGAESEVAQDTTVVESEPAATTDESSADAGDTTGGAVTVEVAGTDLGDVLVDGEGMTLYVFDSDTDETSTCYDDCEANWPPLTGDATAGEGADDALLGTSEREDGTTQVTYGGQPVYYFAGDQSAGDTNGQAVGDVWWVVGADGEAITGAAGGDGADDDEESSGY